MKQHRGSRRADSGTITIIAVAMLTALLAMAGLAVDLGFLYTRSRMMYAVADSAVAVGMKDLMASKSATVINGDIADIAAKYGAAYTITSSATATQVTVKVEATYPLYFAKMLGFPSRKLTVTTIGTGNPTPAILALGSGCGGGVTFNGEGAVNVHGDVQSNGSLKFMTGSPGPNIMGNATAACTPVTKNSWDTVTGTLGPGGGTFPDPFAPFVPPACTFGSTTASYTLPSWGGPWNMTTTPWTLSPGVYCSNGSLQLIDPGTGFNAMGVTLVSVGGTVSIMVNKASTITPNSASPNGIVAYSSANTGTFPGDIAVTGPAGELLTIGGALYAPNGTVNLQQNGPLTIGSLVGSSVYISDFAPWDVGSGGGGSNAWRMSQ
jgi:hypothetical protein